MFYRILSSFFLASIFFTYSSYAYAANENDENTGCSYFSNILETEKLGIESKSSGFKKENAYGYAYTNINQCLNPQLYVDEKIKERKSEVERGLWEKLKLGCMFRSCEEDVKEVQSVSPTIAARCNWVQELESTGSNSLLVQAASCTKEKLDFAWPDEVDWLIAPYILEKLNQARRKSPSTTSEVCALKENLYSYRFWRDAHISTVSVPNYDEKEALGFKIRNELMKQDGCLNEKGKWLNSIDLIVPDKTKDYDEANRTFALNIESENNFELAKQEGSGYLTYKVTLLDQEKGSYKVEPKSESPYLSFHPDEEDDFEGTENYKYIIKYTGENKYFVIKTCPELIYDKKKPESLVVGQSQCEVQKLSENNKLHLEIKLKSDNIKNKYSIKLSIDPPVGTIAMKPFVEKEEGKCINDFESLNAGGLDPRRFYYLFSDQVTSLANYMHLQDESKELIQKNIYHCNKK